MSGIEKITDKIIADARAAESAMLAEAELAAEELAAESERRAAAYVERARANAEREARNIRMRAESSAELLARNIVLDAKSRLIDGAFDSAKEKLAALDAAAYIEIMTKLLREAVAAYGVEPGELELRMNRRDAEAVGQAVIDNIDAAHIRLSPQNAAIDGGFILRCGDIETNCTVSLLVEQLRGDLEGMVYQTLFPAKA